MARALLHTVDKNAFLQQGLNEGHPSFTAPVNLVLTTLLSNHFELLNLLSNTLLLPQKINYLETNTPKCVERSASIPRGQARRLVSSPKSACCQWC
jgi:hypothetical protein